jgi:hypothetical protein
MWYQLIIGAGGFAVLALLLGVVELVRRRHRLLDEGCDVDSIRCLGCMALGRCAREADVERGRRPS